MYNDAGKIDFLPTILIDAHEIVKTWAKELRERVSEYMDEHVAKFLQPGERAGIRPWKKRELETWLKAMQDDRRGLSGKNKSIDKKDG